MRARARGAETGGSRLDRGAQFAFHRGQIFGGRFVAKRPLTHGVGAQGRVTDVRGIVDALGQPVDRVQIFAKASPRPGDASLHRLRRDILGTLEITHH